ncbi:MAG TPA: PLP-dependent cysteine synthase family protein [Candidatus Brocadiia bacterium]
MTGTKRKETSVSRAPVFKKSILESVGNTPLVKLNKITHGLRNVQIYAKLEWFNPGGSVKDRPALRIIEDAEKTGRLTKDKTIIDSTSGNTGVAYALIGAAKGYKVTLVMPSNVSEERKTIVRSFGANIIFTNPLQGSDGAIIEVRRIVKENPERYFYADQYNNPSNWQAHYDTTGVEIWEQTGEKITHFIAGLGTTGTLMGTGRRLKEYNSDIQVISVEPSGPIHGLEGLKHIETAIVPGIYDKNFPDEKLYIETEDAYEMVRRLASEEGLRVGYSSGAAMKVALDVAKKTNKGLIVTIFPDSADRYLSTSYLLEKGS